LRVNSRTLLTAAISAADVLLVGATANGPDAGRASGLKFALAVNKPPRRPIPACAKASVAAGQDPGRLRGIGTCCATAVWVAAVCTAGRVCGRGGGNGAANAHEAPASNATAAVVASSARWQLRSITMFRPYPLISVPDSDRPGTRKPSVRLTHGTPVARSPSLGRRQIRGK
jgi:hypothetical protein